MRTVTKMIQATMAERTSLETENLGRFTAIHSYAAACGQ